jgi:hypothetical protein
MIQDPALSQLNQVYIFAAYYLKRTWVPTSMSHSQNIIL